MKQSLQICDAHSIAQLLEEEDLDSGHAFAIRNADVIPVIFRLAPYLRSEHKHLLIDWFTPFVEKVSPCVSSILSRL